MEKEVSLLDNLLQQAVTNNASDLHITPGLRPRFRIDGNLKELDGTDILTENDTTKLFSQITNEKHRELLAKQGHVDFAYSGISQRRFRINAYNQQRGMSLAVRVIPNKLPSIEELNLPSVVTELTRRKRGLILVVGPAGNGKSTTQAAMLNARNNERADKIITLEDPIEYLHSHKKSIIDQRELYTNFYSFSEALTAALRQDPNVIMVGEMRDTDTIATAMTAALTGALVIGTLHTSDSAQSINRIIDFFPPHQQQQMRGQLAQVLEAIIAQQLLPRADQRGRIVATEILVANVAVKNLIRQGKIEQLNNVLDTSLDTQMKSMDRNLVNLTTRGLISHETALARAIDPMTFTRLIEGGKRM